jgi:ethanolamine utilization protein EutM
MAKQAIGIIETKGFIALIEGADAALKSADIQMTGWDKIGSGLVTGFFTGNVAAVKAGLDAAAAAAANVGTVTSVQVIARPHDDLSKLGTWIG